MSPDVARKPENGEDLRLPEGQNYTCHNTGVCCNVFDTIPADSHCESELKSMSTETCKSLESGPGPFMVPGPDPGTVKVTRKPDGSCVFYGKDHLCAVHKIMGAAAKPQVCRDFPYRYVTTPGGDYVGLSFVCPSVRGNKGKPVAEQRAELGIHRKVAASVQDAPATINLNRRIALSWDEYVALESCFLDLLNDESLTIPQALIACTVIIAYVDAFELHRDNTPRLGPGIRFSGDQLIEFLGMIRQSEYRDAKAAALRKRQTSPTLRRMFSGMFVSFANVLHRTTGRFGTIAGVLASYAHNALPQGRIQLKPVPGKISHKRLAGGRLPTAGTSSELIRRYLSHCIFRKDLLLGVDVSRRLRLLILQVSLLPWYAEAEAASHGRNAANDDDYSEAIGHIEKLYGFHSRFFRFFESNPYFNDIAESFMLRPNYPHFMLGDLG